MKAVVTKNTKRVERVVTEEVEVYSLTMDSETYSALAYYIGNSSVESRMRNARLSKEQSQRLSALYHEMFVSDEGWPS